MTTEPRWPPVYDEHTFLYQMREVDVWRTSAGNYISRWGPKYNGWVIISRGLSNRWLWKHDGMYPFLLAAVARLQMERRLEA